MYNKMLMQNFRIRRKKEYLRQKLNQMSTTQHSNTQTTATTNVVYTSNRNTQPMRLGDNSFGNTGSVVKIRLHQSI